MPIEKKVLIRRDIKEVRKERLKLAIIVMIGAFFAMGIISYIESLRETYNVLTSSLIFIGAMCSAFLIAYLFVFFMEDQWEEQKK